MGRKIKNHQVIDCTRIKKNDYGIQRKGLTSHLVSTQFWFTGGRDQQTEMEEFELKSLNGKGGKQM